LYLTTIRGLGVTMGQAIRITNLDHTAGELRQLAAKAKDAAVGPLGSELVGDMAQRLAGAGTVRLDERLAQPRQDHVLLALSLSYSVRPDGAVHQWRKDPPRELTVGPGS